jgi:hypothetical protein
MSFNSIPSLLILGGVLYWVLSAIWLVKSIDRSMYGMLESKLMMILTAPFITPLILIAWGSSWLDAKLSGKTTSSIPMEYHLFGSAMFILFVGIQALLLVLPQDMNRSPACNCEQVGDERRQPIPYW